MTTPGPSHSHKRPLGSAPTPWVSVATGWHLGQPQTTAEGSSWAELPKPPRVHELSVLSWCCQPRKHPTFHPPQPRAPRVLCFTARLPGTGGGSPSAKIPCEFGGRAAAKPPARGQKGSDAPGGRSSCCLQNRRPHPGSITELTRAAVNESAAPQPARGRANHSAVVEAPRRRNLFH